MDYSEFKLNTDIIKVNIDLDHLNKVIKLENINSEAIKYISFIDLTYPNGLSQKTTINDLLNNNVPISVRVFNIELNSSEILQLTYLELLSYIDNNGLSNIKKVFI